jgi:hypothetical protein
MMFIASLIESHIVKRLMWQKHNIHFANFDLTSLRVLVHATSRVATCGWNVLRIHDRLPFF